MAKRMVDMGRPPPGLGPARGGLCSDVAAASTPARAHVCKGGWRRCMRAAQGQGGGGAHTGWSQLMRAHAAAGLGGGKARGWAGGACMRQ